MKRLQLWILLVFLGLATGPARPAGRDLYPDPGAAKGDLAAAIRTAAAQHKRVIVDFGGNWCGDCRVLDMYMHNEQNLPLLQTNFVLVHINIGRFDENVDLTRRFGIPLEKGVPAVAVLSERGKLLYSQKAGEFESMRSLDASAVTRFLVQWRPEKAGCSAVVVNC